MGATEVAPCRVYADQAANPRLAKRRLVATTASAAREKVRAVRPAAKEPLGGHSRAKPPARLALVHGLRRAAVEVEERSVCRCDEGTECGLPVASGGASEARRYQTRRGLPSSQALRSQRRLCRRGLR